VSFYQLFYSLLILFHQETEVIFAQVLEKSTYLVVKMSNRIPTRYRGWIFHFLVTASRPILAGEVSSKLSAQLQAI